MTDKPKPPSFDDIMKAASRPPERVRKEAPKAVIAPAEANRRKSSAPSFAEIIGSVELRPEDQRDTHAAIQHPAVAQPGRVDEDDRSVIETVVKVNPRLIGAYHPANIPFAANALQPIEQLVRPQPLSLNGTKPAPLNGIGSE